MRSVVNRILVPIFCVIIFIAGCTRSNDFDRSNSRKNETESDYVTASFQLEWEGSHNLYRAKSLLDDNYAFMDPNGYIDPNNLCKVKVWVYDESGGLLRDAEFDYSKHKGTITQVKAGNNRRFVIEGKVCIENLSYVVYIGEKIANLTPNEKNDIGKITMKQDSECPQNPKISINNDASSTTFRSVTLSIQVTDNCGIAAYLISANPNNPDYNNPNWKMIDWGDEKNYKEYKGNINFTLSGKIGLQTVCLWFIDGAGNITKKVCKTIFLIGIKVNPKTGLETTEAGETACFSVALNMQPEADVKIGISSSNENEGVVDPNGLDPNSCLIFTPENWNIARDVIIKGVDDGTIDGDVGYTININAALSADPRYNGLDPDDVPVINKDDDDNKDDFSPKWSPDGSKIAFLSDRDGTTHLWVMNSDGTGHRRATSWEYEEAQFDWVSDNELVFGGCLAPDKQHIYKVIIPEGSPVVIVDTPDEPNGNRKPRWSPIANKLAYVYQPNGWAKLRAINLDGSGKIDIDMDSHADRQNWSNDGTRIAYLQFNPHIEALQTTLYTIKPDGSDKKALLTFPDKYPGSSCAWSPDDQYILICLETRESHYGEALTSGIYRVRGDGSEVIALTDETHINQFTAGLNNRNDVWSPDGSKIIFQSDRDGDFDIYVMDKDGANVINITENTVRDEDASWSPDGKIIVYCSEESGNKDIVLISVFDTDGDSMPDYWENRYNLDPNYSEDSKEDPDKDGLINLEEYNHNTKPFNNDTDGDGSEDGIEVDSESDPLDPESYPYIIDYEIVQWKVEDGGNGHYYQYIYDYDNPVDWNTAKTKAELRGGYLATITSQEENDWIANTFPLTSHLSHLNWIGGYQDKNDPSYSEPSGGWKWVTNEPMDYLNWPTPYQPDNWNGPGGYEDYLTIMPTGAWNDYAEWAPYLVEWDNKPDFLGGEIIDDYEDGNIDPNLWDTASGNYGGGTGIGYVTEENGKLILDSQDTSQYGGGIANVILKRAYFDRKIYFRFKLILWDTIFGSDYNPGFDFLAIENPECNLSGGSCSGNFSSIYTIRHDMQQETNIYTGIYYYYFDSSSKTVGLYNYDGTLLGSDSYAHFAGESAYIYFNAYTDTYDGEINEIFMIEEMWLD